MAVLVSVPYEITLLSNEDIEFTDKTDVSVPYEITLLSNDVDAARTFTVCFSTL